MSTKIQTKYGTAHLNIDGYYKITSNKEGNKDKFLHRLIFEDFYKTKLPPNIVIHHDDHNKTNNEIWNLIPMTQREHTILHHKGKVCSEETKRKISESNTGRIVSEEGRKNMSEAHKGYVPTPEQRRKLSEANKGENSYWYGRPFSEEHRHNLSEAHKGIIPSEETRAKMSEAQKGRTHSLESKLKMSKNKNKTGVFNVFKLTNKGCKQGFTWAYYYDDENGNRRMLSSVSLEKLKKKVLDKGYDWFELINGEWVQCK